MRSKFYFIVVAVVAALQIPRLAPASAEENAAPPPAPAAPPQSQTRPQPQEPQPQSPQPQPPEPQAPSGRDSDDNRRFAFHRVDGNLLRLDMRTGAVAACNQTGAEWTCVPGRDDRAALDRQIAQLQRDNAILKNTLLEHGVALPSGMAPPPPSGAGGWWGGDESIPRPPQTVPPTATPGIPEQPAQGSPPQGASTAGEVDRAMDAVEKGWRRLVEMMMNLKRDLER
jgi:DNA polymerase III subunit gamma/tau